MPKVALTANSSKKLCFVIMGFGKKTDYESGRTLNLDATYNEIIKPAALKNGLRCIRADEVIHSGTIDAEMYDSLYRADIVIADISTGNVNALYELGVRHAMQPNSTIIIAESGRKRAFDLDHTVNFEYVHLGEDIGSREARRAKTALGKLIKASLEASRPDSPVYTYLPRLRKPVLSDEAFESIIVEAEESEEKLAAYLSNGELALGQSKHGEAIEYFSKALELRPGDSSIIQNLVLATYKNGKPNALTALKEAYEILVKLEPEGSNDPETLGLAGAIQKRLWQRTKSRKYLENAIDFYRRGFEFRRDYYNGENLATCLDIRAVLQKDVNEANYDRMSASKARKSIISILLKVIKSSNFDERSDAKWVYATLANCYFHEKIAVKGRKFERLFLSKSPAEWERETYFENKPKPRIQ